MGKVELHLFYCKSNERIERGENAEIYTWNQSTHTELNFESGNMHTSIRNMKKNQSGKWSAFVITLGLKINVYWLCTVLFLF